MIKLPQGGQFDVRDLVAYIKASGYNYIIQGQQNVSLEKHSKHRSLDYWLRQFAPNANTKQADSAVLHALADTGFLEVVDDLLCPETGERCKGLRLVEPA